MQPETDRQYAYFALTGVADTTDIDDVLGLKAFDQWNVGEAFEKRGRMMRRRSSFWRLSSGLADTQPLEKHIEALLSLLEPKQEALLKLSTSFDARLSCVSYHYQSFGFDLPFDIQRRATSLGVRLSFAAYSFGDIHEEIVALREQTERADVAGVRDRLKEQS
ncbi:MAG: DUF4279 domain-containing protein [Pseudomonadota bacterium]